MKRFVLFVLMLEAAVLIAVWRELAVLAQVDAPAPATQTGDVNGDLGLDIGDVIYLLNFLFLGGPPPVALADQLTAEQLAVLARFSPELNRLVLDGGLAVRGSLSASNLHGVAFSGDYNDLANVPEPAAAPPRGVWGTWRVDVSPGDNSLRDIVNDFATGDRRTDSSEVGSLVYLDAELREARRIDFFGATPLRYGSLSFIDNGSGASGRPDVLEFSVERCEYSTSGTGGFRSLLLASDFRFEIFGRAIPNVLAVAPGDFEPDSRPDEPVAGRSGFGLRASVATATAFQVELPAGSGVAQSDWESLAGGDAQLHARSAEDPTLVVEFSPIRLFGTFAAGASRVPLVTLLDRLDVPERRPFEVTVEYRDRTERSVRRVRLLECVPVRYSPPPVDARSSDILEETFEFRARNIEG